MFEIKNGKFHLNGKETNIYSGAIHYFRVLPEYWEDRLTKLKLAGFNCVETYVCWNLHEPKPNQFDFTNRLDIAQFIKTAEKLGLNVILRPGPYICAEWDFGGLPAWLLKDKNMRLRCNDEKFLNCVKNFFKRLFQEIGELQTTKGGNIIAVQIENEYGSFGNDKKYLGSLKEILSDCGVDVIMFTSDGTAKFMLSGGTLPDVYKTVNFGSGAKTAFKSLDAFQTDAPHMCMEFWCGWFDHWGKKHHTRNYREIIKELNDFLSIDANFNFYMFHGGTNFGFTAGANFIKKYLPTLTSYDYCALLNEYGDYTPAYHAVRNALCKKQGLETVALPKSPETQFIGEVELNKCTSLFDNMENIGQKHFSPMPENMEYYNQNFGLIYYKTVISGDYGSCALSIADLHDRGYLYLNGKQVKTFDRTKTDFLKKIIKRDYKLINNLKDGTEISLLVEAMGRVNYGTEIYDRKGISAVYLNNQSLMDFEIISFELDDIEKLDFSKNCGKYPLFYKGFFNTDSKAECFIELKNFTKGAVYINGFNLGRYWKIGPQKTLYLPGALLFTDKPNEITVLELEHCSSPTLNITDKHKLT